MTTAFSLRSAAWPLLVLLLAISPFAAQATPTAEFARANQLYAEQNYAAARDLYEKLAQAGLQDSALYLNLGHVDYRTGRPVQAAINYRRALALDPGNTEARNSFEFVMTQLGVTPPGVGLAETVGRYIPFDLLALLGSAGFWMGVLGLTWVVFSGKRRPLAAVLSILIAAGGATLVGLAWSGDSRVAMAESAIVVSDATDARNMPADNAQKLSDLPLGTPVRVLARHDDWTLVKLPLGIDGWVRSSALEPIFPSAPSATPDPTPPPSA